MACATPPIGLLYPKENNGKGYTYIYFGENQLSRSSIGILPLTIGHLMSLQRQRVRASPSESEGSPCRRLARSVSGQPYLPKRPIQTRFRSASPSESEG